MTRRMPTGNRRMRSNLLRCIVAVFLGACVTSAPVHAAKLRDIFPEFLARRSSLDSVAVLADVVVVRQEGGTPVLRRARTLAFSDSILALTREMLERKGIRMQRALLASMGITYRDELGFRVADTDSTPATELVNPPFFIDSLLDASPERAGAWKTLNRTLLNYERRKKDAAVSLRQGVDVARAVGADAVVIVRVVSWDVPLGKQFASLFDTSRPDMLSSSSFVGLTIISGEDGVIVWDDWISQKASLKPETLRDKMKALERNIP